MEADVEKRKIDFKKIVEKLQGQGINAQIIRRPRKVLSFSENTVSNSKS
ncbi:hypothetical protein [Bacillus sp. AK128]